MPELWVPYGDVETLITIQSENLGAVVQPESEKSTGDTERIGEAVKRASRLFVCDSRNPTIELLAELSPAISSSEGLKLVAAAPKRIESAIPDLKGRITTLAPPMPAEGKVVFAEELKVPGEKIFIGTSFPDPLYGLADAKVQACENWVSRSRMEAAQSRKEMEPTPFDKTDAYEAMEGFAAKFREAKFLSIVPRGGRVRSVLEDAPFDAIKNGFLEVNVTPSKAAIIGAGGRGYDDTLSGALRSVWSVLPGVRSSGQVLLIAECSEGLGSNALEMMATGRLKAETRKKGDHVEGLEDVFYLSKMKDEYDVILLSGLPETYAKSNLGLTTARGSGEAVGRLLNKIGKSSKVNVMSRASECRIHSA